jgi:hypothetical protein
MAKGKGKKKGKVNILPPPNIFVSDMATFTNTRDSFPRAKHIYDERNPIVNLSQGNHVQRLPRKNEEKKKERKRKDERKKKLLLYLDNQA